MPDPTAPPPSWWLTDDFASAAAAFNATARRTPDSALPTSVTDYLDRVADRQAREAAALPTRRAATPALDTPDPDVAY